LLCHEKHVDREREPVITNWRRWIGAAISTGLTWAAAWFAAGFLVARVPGFFSDLPFAIMFAPFGFVTGIVFSAILIVLEHRRRLDRLSPWIFAAWGAASGLLLAAFFAALRAQSFGREFLVFAPLLALASAICAAGSVAVTRRAERREGP
jgi:hypothetical protein